MLLEKKIAIVTGVASGLGTADALAGIRCAKRTPFRNQ